MVFPKGVKVNQIPLRKPMELIKVNCKIKMAAPMVSPFLALASISPSVPRKEQITVFLD
jgi:hypothetical protein